MGNGYKLFIIRGLYIKAGRPMPFAEFVKSKMLKEMLAERKTATERDTKKS